MEDLIYFVQHYPVPVIVGVLFLVARVLGGKKKATANSEQAKDRAKAMAARREELRQEAENRARAQVQQARSASTSDNSDMLAALRNAFNAVDSSSAPNQTLTLPSTSVLGVEENVVERPRQERDAYDVRTNVYDDETELERMDMAALPVPVHRGFGYHSAAQEPDAVEYHTTSFFGFHQVEGLHATGPVAAESIEAEAQPLFSEGIPQNELVRALILKEVLGPPLARRVRS